MKLSTLLKWITGGCEAFLAIPILGGAFIFGSGWTVLMFMFVVHLVTLVFSIRENRSYIGSVFGLVTSVIGLIPFIGWLLHTITAIILLVDAAGATRTDKRL